MQQSGSVGNSDLMLSRGGYKAGDRRKTFAFGRAARGAAEQTSGGIAAGRRTPWTSAFPNGTRPPVSMGILSLAALAVLW
jgi:hypothetical protein